MMKMLRNFTKFKNKKKNRIDKRKFKNNKIKKILLKIKKFLISRI